MTVIDDYPVREENRSRRVLDCVCDCGNTCTVEKSKVLRGHTRSCGCLQQENYESLIVGRRKPPGVAAFNELYGAYRRGAKYRGYDFELTKEQFREIVTGECVYCGDSLTQTMRRNQNAHGANGEFRYTGIDRYDNKLGYTLDNCVPCCKKCNRIKTDMDVSELAERLERIVSRRSIWEKVV